LRVPCGEGICGEEELASEDVRLALAALLGTIALYALHAHGQCGLVSRRVNVLAFAVLRGLDGVQPEVRVFVALVEGGSPAGRSLAEVNDFVIWVAAEPGFSPVKEGVVGGQRYARHPRYLLNHLK
jgi:hypothetical protein